MLKASTASQTATPVVGPKGDRGVKSEKGDPGPKGAKGNPGVNCYEQIDGKKKLADTGKGANAKKLIASCRGKQGLPGLKGNPGPRGEQGQRGEQGSPGARGPRRPEGEKGDTGPRGPKGDQGGPRPKGDQGPRVNPEPQGDPGQRGPKGDPGANGADGVSGYAVVVSLGRLIAANQFGTSAANASCPAGKRLLGGGTIVTNPTGTQFADVTLTAIGRSRRQKPGAARHAGSSPNSGR